MKAPKRREFIPELRAYIAKHCPGSLEQVNASIDLWRDGKEPATPFDRGVFSACDMIARDMDEQS